jgi:hypothetical protein
MSKRLKFDANDYFRDYVEHPRYGKLPIFTGLNHDPNRYGNFIHWHSNHDCRIPDTAILADISRQHHATVRVSHYYDVKRVCLDCKSPYLFFAEEQQFWYEVLGMNLEADCVYCYDCRKLKRAHKRAQKLQQSRYIELCHQQTRSSEEDLEWLELYCTQSVKRSKQEARQILDKLSKISKIDPARLEKCRRVLKP